MDILDFINALVVSDDQYFRIVDLQHKQATTVRASDLLELKPDYLNLSDRTISTLYLDVFCITLLII